MKKLRGLLAVLTVAAMLLFGGCTFSFQLPGVIQTTPTTTPTDTPPASSTDYRSEYAGNWCYRVLSSRMQQMYGAVYAAVREYHTDTWVSIRGGEGETDYIGLKVKLPVAMMDKEEARRLFNAFTADNPQFFFLGNTYSYEGYRLDGTDYYDVFCLTLTMDKEQREQAAARLEQEVERLLSAVPAGANVYETELFLHDALAARVTYDKKTAESPSPAAKRPAAFTAFGALVEQSAVCEGYARAMQLLLHRAGVACTVVTGSALEGETHMWNLVEIDGRGYHLDPTWDDADDRLHHTFFNLTTEQIKRSHAIDRDNLGVDTCTATEANFFVREQRELDVYDRSLIAEAVAAQVKAGEPVVELRFSAATFANAQLFFSNPRLVRQYVSPFLTGEQMWNYTCVTNDLYGTVTLYPEK